VLTKLTAFGVTAKRKVDTNFFLQNIYTILIKNLLIAKQAAYTVDSRFLPGVRCQMYNVAEP